MWMRKKKKSVDLTFNIFSRILKCPNTFGYQGNNVILNESRRETGGGGVGLEKLDHLVIKDRNDTGENKTTCYILKLPSFVPFSLNWLIL